MRLILLSISLCITANLLSQPTARPNPYITANISYDSDPENKKINRLDNLKGDVTNLTSYVYNISSKGDERFDEQRSFKYAFNRNKQIETEWLFKQADQPHKKIAYQSFIKNRVSQVESFITDGQINTKVYEYDGYNRLIKTSTTEAGQQTEILIPVNQEDSLDVFHIEGKIYTYEEDRLLSIEQENSKMSKRYTYRGANTLKSVGDYKRVEGVTSYGFTTSHGSFYQCKDEVQFRHKGLVRGFWSGTYNAGDEWLASLGSYYKYNEDNQIIKKYRREIVVQKVGWQIDSTIFTYVYNDKKLLSSIIKNGNQIKPMVTFEYNRHGDMIYSLSPAGELKYTFSDYDTFNNWRTKEKHLNGVLQTREERVIEYVERE